LQQRVERVVSDVATRVGELLGAEVTAVARVSGGDVADARRVILDDGRIVFAKTHRNPPPFFFETEAAGLEWLAAAHAVDVAEVIVVEPGLLVLAWIDEGHPVASTEADFGRELAVMHRAGSECFGRTDRRTTGSRALPNEPCSTWAEFYAANRLEPLAGLAADGDVLGRQTLTRLDRVVSKLTDFGAADEPPARLHGDLWAGNRLVDTAGRNRLIDPAAHGGHREFDLAMMRLFGGFGRDCYDAYDDEWPLTVGWEDRVPLHQLAPLIVHAVKFGGGYVGAVDRALDQLEAL